MRGISYTNVLIAALLIFCFTNMTAAQDATISVITPPYILFETVAPGIPDQIKVQLSTPFHEAVTVDLAVTPTNSPANGTLTLSAYTVTIPAGQLERSVTIANNKDGTALSRNLGFTITPTVSGTSAAAAHFTSMQSSSVLINNSDPYFISTSMDTEAVAGLPKDFYWSISDVVLDQPLLTVTWDWGDGSSDTYTGANGNITHIYATAGIYNVYIIAEDKDNGVVSRQITVNVSPSQTLQVIPVGPNPAGYYGAGTIKRLSNSEGSGTGGGLGYGIVLACLPLPISQGNYGNAYYFHYGDGVAHALIEAEPYKTAMNGYYYVTKFDNNGVADPTALGPLVHDSFFFTWFEDSRQGCDSGGLSEADRNPASTTPTAIVMLPSTTADENGDGSENVIRSVRAIFSLEWITSDNVGE